MDRAMEPKRPRGRPAKYVLDRNKRPVVGLSQNEANNVFYNTHWRKDGKLIYFGTNLDEAIFKFRQWDAKRGKSPRTILPLDEDEVRTILDRSPHEIAFKIEWEKQEKGSVLEAKGKSMEIGYYVPESSIWAKAREMILQDITEARKQLNLPIVLDGLVKPLKSISLEEIGDLYFTHPRFSHMSQRYRWEAKRYWKEFCKLVKVKSIQDLTIQTIDGYQEAIYSKSNARKWDGGASINNRFSAIKTIFKNATKRTKDVIQIPDIEMVQGYLKRLTYASKAKVNPKPISKDNYLLMLKSEINPTYRAILLLALNCGMKESGIVAVKKENIDLKKKTLHMPRPKTGIIRVACLWDRTCKAIREMLNKVDNDTDYLFLNETGKPLRRASINEWWMRRRRKLGIDESIKFEHIRDATQTIPVENDSKCLDEVRLIMGHAVAGIANSYLERRPNMVRNACKAIEDYYFGTDTP